MIYFLKGKYNIKEKIKIVGIENCYLSEITIAELKFGAAKSSNFKKHSKEVDLMEELFTVIPIYPCLDKFAQEKTRLQKEGKLIPDFDLLIGVTSVNSELKMVTNNVNHLKRIKNVNIENWIK